MMSMLGEPMTCTLSAYSPMPTTRRDASAFDTKCRCDIFVMVWRISSSTVPDSSPPSMWPTRMPLREPTMAPASASTRSPCTTMRSTWCSATKWLIPLMVSASTRSIIESVKWSWLKYRKMFENPSFSISFHVVPYLSSRCMPVAKIV